MAGGVSLGAAVATVHRDPRWWRLCLLYGAAAATGLGLPLAAGFVMESLDNSRRGYPTPLPPWADPWTRSLAGLLALMIDFAFFVLPFLVAGGLTICVSVALVLAAADNATVARAVAWLLVAAGLAAAALFLAGVAPVGRLVFAREGRVEDAISGEPLRLALGPWRAPLIRARLASLPAYLPALALAALTYALARPTYPAQALAVAAGAWLTLAALVYAHLVVVQLYVSAEREVQRRQLGM